ncbi:MAG: T9SS type A sorting domain-containing protein [Bacteroidota bacterium]
MKNLKPTFFISLLFFTFNAMSQPRFNWQKQYDAPVVTPGNDTLTSTEVVDMVSHKGFVYAATSNWNNPNDRFRGQVLVKKSSELDWELDYQTEGRMSRASAIKSVVFSFDKMGQPLEVPDTVLFIGLTNHKGWQPEYPGRVAWRNDTSQSWTIHDLGYTTHHLNRTEVRSIGYYRDKITGADIVFAGATPAPLGIIAGRYDPDLPQKIEWDIDAEFLPVNFERIIGFAECNGSFFAATKSRILKRNDGLNPETRWEELIDFLDPEYLEEWGQGIYDLYARDEDIRSFRTWKDESGKEYLMFTTFNRIILFDPVTEELSVELNICDWLNDNTSEQYNYIQSGIIHDLNFDGKTYQAIGIEAIFDTIFINQNNPAQVFGIDTRGMILLRDASDAEDITYQLLHIEAPEYPADTLTRVRTLVNSPFPDEPDEIYAGGFAPWGNDVQHTGWIYKGNPAADETAIIHSFANPGIMLYPNPVHEYLYLNLGNNQIPQSIEVLDSQGQMINRISGRSHLNVQSLLPGNYFLRVTINNSVLTTKFIKL